MPSLKKERSTQSVDVDVLRASPSLAVAQVSGNCRLTISFVVKLRIDGGTLNSALTAENTGMMLDWNEYRRQLAYGVKEVGQLSPDTVKGYIELSSAGQKADLLGAKIRELIALAVAVTRAVTAASRSTPKPRFAMAQPRKRSRKHWVSPLP